jgi:hypothetical protein
MYPRNVANPAHIHTLTSCLKFLQIQNKIFLHVRTIWLQPFRLLHGALDVSVTNIKI